MNRNHVLPATLPWCFVAFILMLTTSCSTGKKLNYFNDLPDAETYELKAMPVPERIIERGDRLDVNFIVKDQESASYFNKHSMAGAANAAAAAVGVGGGGGGGATAGADYVVNEEGEIEIPVIGRLKLSGLTISQAKQKLYSAVSPYLKEPLIELSFTTFKVTVLGEVKTPGSFVIPSQQATIFTALAAAGDLPHSAKRYDIRLYRDYNGKRTIRKFDLRKASVLEDPDIFLMRPNDVIYVQARSGSVFKEESGLIASLFTIVISVVTLGFTIHNTTK
jgi:polysaccharide export outer membrane protein